MAVGAEVHWAVAAVPDSVLATRPDVLVALAERAVRQADEAASLRAQLGKRPPLDVDAEREALAEWSALQDDRRAAAAAREERLRLMTMANAAGVGWLTAAIGLSFIGRQPLGPTIDLAVALAATSPIAGYVTGSTRAKRAKAALVGRRAACADALERAGAKTMGDLRARRILLDSWSVRRDALRMAHKQATDALAAWHEVAGSDFGPDQVDLVVARCVALRREALERLRAVLAAEHQRRAAEAEAEVAEAVAEAEVILSFPEQPAALSPGGRMTAGLERLQGLRLRLWRTA